MRAPDKGVRSRLMEELYTYCAFWIALSTLPALALSYIVVRISKHIWLKLLSSRYPGLDFIRTNTVRSLLDTHRNQGIINVLLCVKGIPDTELIKRHVTEHLIERRDADGELMFPRLRHQLVSCWGNYAWDENVIFRLENHFMLANAVYRGRPVTDNNIQDFVSETVSKYFPTEQSPWQYIIIPCLSAEPKYYILVRVHHLLLTGRRSMNIGDFMLLEQSPSERTQTEYYQTSPLLKLFPNPSAIPELLGKLNENLSNAWNEFVSEYDPVESPRALKSLPGAFHVAGLILISGVSALRELNKRSRRDSRSVPPITATTLLAATQRECKRRNLTIPKVLISPLVTADPRKWPQRVIGTALTTTKEFLKLPIRVKDELMALNEIRCTGQTRQAHTLTWKYGELGQLCARASKEAWRGIVETYRAPAKLWEDTIGADDGQRHLLQTVSLCGRKVAAWSRPVPRAGIERAARALGVSSTDVALFAATDGIRAFFEHAHAEPPEAVLTTARAASEDFLFTFAEGHGKRYKKSQTGGMICLSLPVGATPRRIAAVVEQACARQGALAGAWAAQARWGALTRAVPSPFAKLTLNVLSRRYAVSYAEIDAPLGSRERKTLWGQTVDYVVYWRPPQANISMSLTVIQYADTVRLAVMTDARLSPAHTVPATRWPMAIEQLIAKVDQEIARIAAQTNTNIPQIITPREQTASDETQETVEETQSPHNLRPPAPTVSSPPPFRRRVTHH
ncbi:uncharacterized protein LOC106142857 [Amyelois transitella]|uniref:uncharacterized protein LOC106142857 n=1 Tax=Amyelois transitella TaxID=680683 RepID=UPI002990298E|nr:uncharacterized protein LOC106142857 [Amyelois transitella]XP_060801953.1 uncharacterized protein LOC106142857 [Amyelois transitella]